MIRGVSRRLERLESRAALASKDRSISFRIHLVDPEKGLTGVLVLESDKPTTHVPPTPEEIERVRAELEQRRAARIPSDISSYQPASPDRTAFVGTFRQASKGNPWSHAGID